jgi:hypothetical protein
MQDLNYNIAFVYEYGDELWSTPSSLIKEFEKRGHNVKRHHLTKDDLEIMPKENYDIVITLDWKGIDIPEEVHSTIKASTFLVRECADTPQNYDKHLPYIKNYDLLLTPDYNSNQKYVNLGATSIWFNHFADTEIHCNYSGIDDYPPVRSTRGPGGSQLMDYLTKLIPEKFVNRNGLIGKSYGEFLNNGSITLQHSRWGEITRRIFEGMACNTMILTDRLSKETHVNDLFEEDEDIVYYDNIPMLISKINYYLSPEGTIDRLRIANNGYNKVIQHHTQKNRVDAILNEYDTWIKSSLL